LRGISAHTSNKMSLNSRVSKNVGRGRTTHSRKPNLPGSTVHERGKCYLYFVHSILNKRLIRFIVSDPQRQSELLLSKSNYQLLIEGESSQAGISFPPSIFQTLSCKRTSHTIAERGRRNDMKKALQELATLLSQDCCDEASQNTYAISNAGKYAKAQAKTKVCTVELAIEYIKCLQKALAGAKSSLKVVSSKDSSASSEAVIKVQLSA